MRRDAGRHAHRDGEDVVGEQRDPGDLRGEQPEVVAGHDVRAARARVRLDRLAVREHEDHEQRDDARSTAASARRTRPRPRPGAARRASLRSRTPPTTAHRWRRPRARSGWSAARASPGRCGDAGRTAWTPRRPSRRGRDRGRAVDEAVAARDAVGRRPGWQRAPRHCHLRSARWECSGQSWSRCDGDRADVKRT